MRYLAPSHARADTLSRIRQITRELNRHFVQCPGREWSRGSVRHGRNREAVSRVKTSESIEPSLRATTKLANPLVPCSMSPAGMRPAGAEPNRRSPRGERAGRANQSNLRAEPPLSSPTFWHFALCPRRESNPHLRFRKPPFYPLNYGDAMT